MRPGLDMLAPAPAGLPPAVGPFDVLAARPQAPALTGAGGTVAAGGLHAMACGAAAGMDALGVPPGARVAVVGPKSPGTIALVLACLRSGRPVLLPAPELPSAVVGELLRSAGVERVLAAAPAPGAETVPSSPGAAAPAPPSPAAAPANAPAQIALMLTTSGSTGAPKVVPISHAAIARFAGWAAERFGIAPGTNVLSYCGLNFDLSLLEVWTTLLRGGTVVLAGPDDVTRPERLLTLVREHETHVIQGVPVLHRLLLDAAEAHGCTLPHVRHAILTGDAAPAGLLARLPGPFTHARLHNVYGCTETNDSFAHEVRDPRELAAGTLPLGEPLPGVSALVLRDGRVLEGEGVGELWVRTPFQAPGYLGPTRAGDGFAPQPAAHPAHGHFRSGDLVRRDADGRLWLEGRLDAQVKVRGVRVNLEAVERTLLAGDDVAEAAVVAVADELAGRRVHALVRPRRGRHVDTLGLRASCVRAHGRAAVPASIDVQDQPLPRTVTGKVDRKAVRSIYEKGRP